MLSERLRGPCGGPLKLGPERGVLVAGATSKALEVPRRIRPAGPCGHLVGQHGDQPLLADQPGVETCLECGAGRPDRRRHLREPGGDVGPVRGGGTRHVVEDTPDPRNRTEDVGQVAPVLARLMALDLALQAVSYRLRGPAITVGFDRDPGQSGERVPIELGAPLGPDRRVVGQLTLMAGYPVHGSRHRVQPGRPRHVVVGNVVDRSRHGAHRHCLTDQGPSTRPGRWPRAPSAVSLPSQAPQRAGSRGADRDVAPRTMRHPNWTTRSWSPRTPFGPRRCSGSPRKRPTSTEEQWIDCSTTQPTARNASRRRSADDRLSTPGSCARRPTNHPNHLTPWSCCGPHRRIRDPRCARTGPIPSRGPCARPGPAGRWPRRLAGRSARRCRLIS